MTGDARPLLALGVPAVGEREKRRGAVPPKLSTPAPRRQGERLEPRLTEMLAAFDQRRVQLETESSREIDPELVLVFDLAGSVAEFYNAVRNVYGMEFLAEQLDEDLPADDDFYMIGSDGNADDKPVGRSLQVVLSNAQAAKQLVRLFQEWVADPKKPLPRRLGRFKPVFAQLRDIRHWGANDRIRATGLLKLWQQTIQGTDQPQSSERVEIELWYRQHLVQRENAEQQLRKLIKDAGGTVKRSAVIEGIDYHALLVELPHAEVARVVKNGAEHSKILAANQIMFVNPSTPMSVTSPLAAAAVAADTGAGGAKRELGEPRIALLDGLPLVQHERLAGRLRVDDPDDLGSDYAVSSRRHGTAMASLIAHGDLCAEGAPLERKLYVRPIMRPASDRPDDEEVLTEELFVDLLHRAIRRIVDGEGVHQAAASSVRIINLSVGDRSRALVRKMSALGRLLDWLAVEKNLLFIVSAGNHDIPLVIPRDAAGDEQRAKRTALKNAWNTARQRGILPPGDALNAITVGALHDDAAEDPSRSQHWDLTDRGMPAHYNAVGPGVGRSIKPDVYHSGGRTLYVRPVVDSSKAFELKPARTPQYGPGTLVAAPGSEGELNGTAFTAGTSNAAALVTREASRIFDVLEAGADRDDPAFPDERYHPVLAKALLVHSSTWGARAGRLTELLELQPQQARRELTALLGYGAINPARAGNAASNRAVLIAADSIATDEMHSYQVPLPSSLKARADWHRFTITLTYFAPTTARLVKYRSAKVFFDLADKDRKLISASRAETEHNMVRRGSCQHEIFEGTRAMVFDEGENLTIPIQCMNDGKKLEQGYRIRYGLVVSVEVSVEASTTIHDEVRAALRARASAQAQLRPRVRG